MNSILRSSWSTYFLLSPFSQACRLSSRLVFHQHITVDKVFCGSVMLGNAGMSWVSGCGDVISHHFSYTMLLLVTTGKLYSCSSFVISVYMRFKKTMPPGYYILDIKKKKHFKLFYVEPLPTLSLEMFFFSFLGHSNISLKHWKKIFFWYLVGTNLRVV